jgi:hypothetical protein
MASWKRIAVWSERLCASVLALLTLAVVLPDLIPGGRRVSDTRMVGREVLLAFMPFVGILSGLVAMIIVGQKRSRALRIAGWSLLLAFVVLEFTR